MSTRRTARCWTPTPASSSSPRPRARNLRRTGRIPCLATNQASAGSGIQGAALHGKADGTPARKCHPQKLRRSGRLWVLFFCLSSDASFFVSPSCGPNTGTTKPRGERERQRATTSLPQPRERERVVERALGHDASSL